MKKLNIWGLDINLDSVSEQERNYLLQLPKTLPSVDWVWQEMDRVWRRYDMDSSKPLSKQRTAEFYSHPVWLMNGIFTHLDPVSSGHRHAIAKYLKQTTREKLADYGGGFGEMALTLRKVIPESDVTVVEPFPSTHGLERLKSDSHIRVQPDLPENTFDAVIAQDVLEHVEDPVFLAHKLSESVREGGLIVFANCFYPYIACHLPSTFHLRHTFIWVMKRMGLKYRGVIKGAYHAQVFERTSPTNIESARRAEAFSKKVAPLLNNPGSTLLSKVKRRLLMR
jgi:2-polyprenyl-6-hydroxyphenyl methylase/3-demethylubiquinone-9 3-methyltransferase